MNKQAEYGPNHIAAKQELESRRDAREQIRHQESIRESQASRRLDKWAFGVAFVALLVGGAGLWRSFLPAAPSGSLPASASSTPVDPVDSIHGTTPKPSAPATLSAPSLPIPMPDEKPPTSPTLPKTEEANKS